MSQIREDFNKEFPFIQHHDYSYEDLLRAARWMAERCEKIAYDMCINGCGDECVSKVHEQIDALAKELSS